jgi:hypothetical protein
MIFLFYFISIFELKSSRLIKKQTKKEPKLANEQKTYDFYRQAISINSGVGLFFDD